MALLINKAKSAVLNGRILKLQLSSSYFYVYVFVGKFRDYLLFDGYCTCKYSIFNNIYRNSKNKCYHQLALDFALYQDKVKKLEVDERTIMDIIMEIYSMDKSFILRKLLFSRG